MQQTIKELKKDQQQKETAIIGLNRSYERLETKLTEKDSKIKELEEKLKKK
jgi:uncharacterized protein involved in exopolysaccharide biosynthesis